MLFDDFSFCKVNFSASYQKPKYPLNMQETFAPYAEIPDRSMKTF